MSKAILFADLHCNNKQLQNLYDFVIQNKNIDVLIFAGDVVNMGEPVWFMEKFIKMIAELKKPFYWVPGNNDFGRAYYKLSAKYKSIEGRVTSLSVIPAKAGIQKDTILDPRVQACLPAGRPEDDKEKSCHPERSEGPLRLTGVGGSPASWAGQYEGESMIDQKDIAGSIFISHFPPPGILVLQQKDIKKPNFGRKFSNSPLVHICGHLHYRWGTAYLGQTKVIQLASLETGHYAILDLETLAVKFERFRYGNNR